MKKTPILLSTLALVTGITGSMTTALNLTSPVLAIEVAADVEQNVDIYMDELYKMNDYFRIAELDFKKNRIVYDINRNFGIDGIKAQRTLIVMRDYESGVSETEASEKSKTLGVGDSDWYTTLVDSKVVAATNYIPLKNYDLKDNLSDVLYFAIQFGETVTDASGKKTLKDEYWVRGKVDYRKCIHSALFDPETMVCTTYIDYGAKTASIAAIDAKGDFVLFPEDEQVITWEEEWKSVIKERISVLNTQLIHMDTQLSTVETTLSQVAAVIKDIQKMTGELKDTKEVDDGLAQLEILLKQVQNTYDWMIGAEQQKIMAGLQADLDEALAEIERLRNQPAGDSEEIIKVQKELEKVQSEVKTLQEKLSEVNAHLGLEVANSAAAKQELAQIETKMKEILVEKEGIMQKMQVLTNDNNALEAGNNELRQENADLQMKNTEILTENTMLAKKNAELSAVNVTLVAENADLVKQNTELREQNQGLVSQNEALQAKIKELEAALAKKPVCTVITEVQVEGKTEGEDIKSTDVEIMGDTETNEVVEVPSLGSVETKTNFWWVIAGVAAALGALGMYCKKRLSRER